jgi:hypothetical protein
MLRNTALAAWNNVDLGKIIGDMTQELLGSSLNEYVSDQLTRAATEKATELLGESMGATAGSVAAAVQMDFGALGKGDFKNAISFDPSAIVITTPVADISGYVRFVEVDPVWGKSWQAKLNASVKVPKPFAAYVGYINGTKMRADSSTYKFWILDVGVSKLGLLLTPLPIAMDAAKGKVYQHVRRDAASNTYTPSEEVRFGVNFDASFLDRSGGRVAFFDVGLGATVMDKGFILEIYGKVDAANIMREDREGNLALQKSLITGTGNFTLNTIDGTFLGRSTVKTNTDPLICSGGSLDVAITKKDFLLALGTREQPLKLDVLCRGKPQLAGWFALSDQSLDMGAYVDVDLNLSSGWIGGSGLKIRPWARFKFYSGFTTLVYWDPFKISEASIWLDLYAGVGVDYQALLSSGSLTIASVGLGGALRYVADPESIVSGKLYGKVTVLGVGFGVDFNASVKL